MPNEPTPTPWKCDPMMGHVTAGDAYVGYLQDFSPEDEAFVLKACNAHAGLVLIAWKTAHLQLKLDNYVHPDTEGGRKIAALMAEAREALREAGEATNAPA